MDGPRILSWIAIILLIDAGIALLGLNKFQAMAPTLNIRKLAMIETAIATLLVAIAMAWRYG